jgi:hypothetical protein
MLAWKLTWHKNNRRASFDPIVGRNILRAFDFGCSLLHQQCLDVDAVNRGTKGHRRRRV